jgi:hypothetical protein
MKNLHVLTTDKPNFGKYLVLNKEGKLCIWNTNTMGSQKNALYTNTSTLLLMKKLKRVIMASRHITK